MLKFNDVFMHSFADVCCGTCAFYNEVCTYGVCKDCCTRLPPEPRRGWAVVAADNSCGEWMATPEYEREFLGELKVAP